MIVEAGSRLHLGFHNIRSGNWFYGSLGIYIEEPKVVLSSSGNGPKLQEVSGLREEICKSSNKAEAVVLEHPPRHVGFGSTTQLYLAAGKLLSVLCGKKLSAERIALIARRGEISGIGIHAFKRGGFIVDSGRTSARGRLEPPKKLGDLPKLIVRLPFPRDWAVIVVLPKGVKGREEAEEGFMLEPRETEEFNRELAKSLWSYVIRGLTFKELPVFGDGVERIQRKMGEYFMEYQGGLYSSVYTEVAVSALKKASCVGVGQSSWGPVAYGFSHLERANDAVQRAREILKREGVEAEVFVTRARNRGYELRKISRLEY